MLRKNIKNKKPTRKTFVRKFVGCSEDRGLKRACEIYSVCKLLEHESVIAVDCDRHCTIELATGGVAVNIKRRTWLLSIVARELVFPCNFFALHRQLNNAHHGTIALSAADIINCAETTWNDARNKTCTQLLQGLHNFLLRLNTHHDRFRGVVEPHIGKKQIAEVVSPNAISAVRLVSV